MSPDNPQQSKESALDSWPLIHQQVARDYIERIRNNPLVKKIVGATTNETFVFLGVYVDFEGDEDLHDAISDAEYDITHKFPETKILFHLFDKSDVNDDVLLNTLREASEYKAPAVLFEREKQTVQA